MNQILENLWNDYLMEKCAVIDTEEERELNKTAAELHEKTSALLNEEQNAALELYIDALLDSESLFVKRAFFKGCEFAVSFILEAGNYKK